MGLLPGRGTKIPQAEQLSLQTTTTEPAHFGVHVPQLESPHASTTRARVTQVGPHATTAEAHTLCSPRATTRVHAPQQRMAHNATEIPHTATRTRHSQVIFKSFKFIVEVIYWNNLSYQTLYCVIYSNNISHLHFHVFHWPGYITSFLTHPDLIN